MATAVRPLPRRSDGSPGLRGERFVWRQEELGELTPVGRPGGQGRVYRPSHVPQAVGAAVVVKLYRQPPPARSVRALAQMVAWSRSLDAEQRARLEHLTAWPIALLATGQTTVGIVMYDLSSRFEVPFVMPSGRRQLVLPSLEHLLGADHYLQLRGLDVRLDTTMRAKVAAGISGGLAFLHRHGIVASDIAPNNLLVTFRGGHPEVCFIDCDSMVFRGRQALPPVETGDWQIPDGFASPVATRAADAYKLGLVILRLFARSHDARDPVSHLRHVPAPLRDLLERALSPNAANRPPAGEWQRSLRELLARGGLDARYPGPAPAPKEVKAPAPVKPPAEGSTWRPAPARRAPAPAFRPAPSGAKRPRTYRPLTLAWLLLAVIVFILIFSRLVASLSPTAGGGSFNPGPAGGSDNGPSQYYFVPSAPGTAFR